MAVDGSKPRLVVTVTSKVLRGVRRIYERAADKKKRWGYRVKLWRYRLHYPQVEFGAGVEISGKLIIKGPGRIRIGNNCIFDDANRHANQIWTFGRSAFVDIGDNCYINGI